MLSKEAFNLCFLLDLGLLRHRQMMERDAMSLDLRCQIGMVGDHEWNLGVLLARLPPPEQVNQTMPLL